MTSLATYNPSHHWHHMTEQHQQHQQWERRHQHQQQNQQNNNNNQQQQQLQRRELQQRLQLQSKRFELLISDLQRKLNVNTMDTNESQSLENDIETNGSNFSNNDDGVENVWRDFETVVRTKKWENVLRERVSRGKAAENFSIDNRKKTNCASSLSISASIEEGVDHSKVMKFLKPAMEMAVRRGNLCDVRSLFRLVDRYGTSFDEDEAMGGAFLSELMAEAVTDGRVNIVTELVRNGAEPNRIHKERSHLSRAIASGACSMITTLIRQGADPNETTPTGKTILHEAASSSSSDIINCLLDNGACLDIRDKIQGNTPLHTACSYCNRKAIFAFYDRGVEFNSVNHFGDTPLAKLLRPLTKAENFHNKTRLDLAKDIIRIGFTLAPKQTGRKSRNQISHLVRFSENDLKLFDSPIIPRAVTSSSFPQNPTSPKGKTMLNSLGITNLNEEEACAGESNLKFELQGSKEITQRHCPTNHPDYKSCSQRIGDYNDSKVSLQRRSQPILQSSLSSSKRSIAALSTSPNTSATPTSAVTSITPVRKHFSSLRSRIAAARLIATPETHHTRSTPPRTTSTTSPVLSAAPFTLPATSAVPTSVHSASPLLSVDIHAPSERSRFSSAVPIPSFSPQVPERAQHHPSKEDRMWEIYHNQSRIATSDLSLQQRCRLTIIHSLGTRPLSTSLTKLGLPNLVIRYLRQGGRES